MFENGSLVTLRNAKSHGEGEDEMSLSSGTCGMIVQLKRKKPDSNHEYIVDFGPYGQWYCYQEELVGQETIPEEGFDNEEISYPVDDGIFRLVIGNSNAVKDEEDSFTKIDFEADLKRRMREIESGEF